LTAEEHQIGAPARRVSAIQTESPELYDVPLVTGSVGVKDRFWRFRRSLITDLEFEVSAVHNAHKGAQLLAFTKKRSGGKKRSASICFMPECAKKPTTSNVTVPYYFGHDWWAWIETLAALWGAIDTPLVLLNN